MLAGGIKAAMKIIIRLLRVGSPDIKGHLGIERIGIALCWDLVIGIKVEDLTQRMHTGVGASGTMDGDLTSSELLDSSLDLLLDAVGIELPLPAAIAGAIILDGDAYSHSLATHRLSTTTDATSSRNTSVL